MTWASTSSSLSESPLPQPESPCLWPAAPASPRSLRGGCPGLHQLKQLGCWDSTGGSVRSAPCRTGLFLLCLCCSLLVICPHGTTLSRSLLHTFALLFLPSRKWVCPEAGDLLDWTLLYLPGIQSTFQRWFVLDVVSPWLDKRSQTWRYMNKLKIDWLNIESLPAVQETWVWFLGWKDIQE